VQLTILLQAERRKIPYKLTSTNDIQRISTQKNPEGIVAVAPIQIMPLKQIDFNRPSLYLWEINDPGNLGTILRCAAWFDIRNILLSPNSVDVFSPKAVRASMGAVFKLHLTFPVDFPTLREYTPTQTNFLAADITGAPLIQPEASTAWILIIGSESHGLPEAILQHIDRKICIPRIGSGESLNVGVAAGIILYQLTLKL
jgi:TrmH family RNA methyltransferase